jgi:prefoldin subunit 5
MDVYPPHRSINTWKDFLVHLVTITIGLFIALSLEAAVEALHHRHLVRDARANLHQGIAANRTLYAANVRRLRDNREQLKRDIEQLRQLRSAKAIDHAQLTWDWEWNSYSGVAWRAARDSGAVTYMDPNLISSYSRIYLQQDYINTTALQIMSDETKTGAALQIAGDAANLTSAQIDALLLKTAEIDLSIGNLQTTMKALQDMYAAEP